MLEEEVKMLEGRWRDPAGELGRGVLVLLALTVPFASELRLLPLPGSEVQIPVLPLLLLLATSAALWRAYRLNPPAAPYGYLLMFLLLLTGISSAGMGLWQGDVWAGFAKSWGFLFLTAAVAVLYKGLPVERYGLVTTLLLATTIPAILTVSQAISTPFQTPVGLEILQPLAGVFPVGEHVALLCALLLPPLIAGSFLLTGRRRQVLLLILALFWSAVLFSFSVSVPFAALAGILALVLAVRHDPARHWGVTVVLMGVVLLGALHPALRARWSSNQPPLNLAVRAVMMLQNTPASDSLHFTLYNPGPLDWTEEMELGYHVFHQVPGGRGEELELVRGGWISRKITSKVASGTHTEVTLPFFSRSPVGFLLPGIRDEAVDSRLRGYSGALFLFHAREEGGVYRINSLLDTRKPAALQAAAHALSRGEGSRGFRDGTAEREDVLALTRLRPLAGLGPGATEGLLGQPAARLYLEMLVSYGWVGTLFILLALGWLLFRLLLRGTMESCMLASSLLVLLFHGLVGNGFTSPSIQLTAALLLGLALAHLVEHRDREKAEAEG